MNLELLTLLTSLLGLSMFGRTSYMAYVEAFGTQLYAIQTYLSSELVHEAQA